MLAKATYTVSLYLGRINADTPVSGATSVSVKNATKIDVAAVL